MERFELSRDPGAGDPRPPARARSPALARQRDRGGVHGPARAHRRAARRSSATRRRSTALIRDELLEIKQIYGRNDDRRTEIVAAEEELELEDLIAEEDMVIAITRSGYIKRLPVTAYREQRRGGIGVMGMELKDDDYIEHLFVASTHDYILFFTNVGKVYRLKVHELPLGSRQSKGRAIVNLLPFRQDETVRAVVQTRNFERGEVPRLRDEERRRQEDRARGVQHAAQGRRDHRDQDARRRRARRRPPLVRQRRHPHGLEEGPGDPLPRDRRAARWGATRRASQGMKLRAGDEVISINIAEDDADLLVVTENGYGKRTRVSEYPVKGRGGMGVKTVQLTEARGYLVGSRVVRDGYQVMLISTGRHRDQDAGRGRQAARPLHAGRDRDAAPRRRRDRVSALAPVVESEEPRRRRTTPATRGRRPPTIRAPIRQGGVRRCPSQSNLGV